MVVESHICQRRADVGHPCHTDQSPNARHVGKDSSFQVVEAAEDYAEDCVREKDGEGSTHSVVESEEARRFEVAGGGGTMIFAGHARVDSRERREHYNKKKQSVDDADDCANPPSGFVKRLEDEDVAEGEHEAIGEVDDGAVDSSTVAVSCKNAANEQRETHACCAESLANALHRCEDCGRDNGPE
jgi:hypothetical protein